MASVAIPIILAEAAGWSSKTEVGVVLMLVGFLLLLTTRAGEGAFNPVAAVGLLLLVAGFAVAVSN